MIRWFSIVALLIASAVPARAALPRSRAQTLLLSSPTPAALRASLIAYADSVAATDRYGAGEARYFAGMSFGRAGAADSAIVCYEQAQSLRGGREEALALADALITRRGPGDLDLVQSALRDLAATAGDQGPAAAAIFGRIAWAQFLAGNVDTAFVQMERHAATLVRTPEWRYRLGRVQLAHGDEREAFYTLLPAAVMSRGKDVGIRKMLTDVANKLGSSRDLEAMLTREIAVRDTAELLLIQRLGGRRIRFSSVDGFPLSAAAFAPPRGAARQRAAIVLAAPWDTLAAYDSLTTQLRRAGLAVALLDLRGSRWSIAPGCPLPDAWYGREAEMHSWTAKDARAALRALALVAAIDTTRYLVVGVGATASMAVEAADNDRRVQSLLLVSPNPAPVDRGPMRARLARLRVPTYFQTAPEDYTLLELVNELAAACDPTRVRVGDATMPGHGAVIFRTDANTGVRFRAWLADQPVGAPRPTPPRPRP